MITRDEIDLRTAKGAKWMDANAENWHNVVDPEIIKMSSCFRCVWGQFYGEYKLKQIEEKGIESVEYGFAIDIADVDGPVDCSPRFDAAHKMLTEAWKAEIVKRRELKCPTNL